MENIKLSDEQRKIINKYNLYLMAVVGDSGLYWDGYISEDEGLYDFDGPYTRRYSMEDDIDRNGNGATILNDILEMHVKNKENQFIDFLYCDDCTGYGSLNVRYSPTDSTIHVNLSITTRDSQETENFMSFDDLKNQTQNQWGSRYEYLKKLGEPEFIEKMKKDYGNTLEITYNGGGDSGQIEDYGENESGDVTRLNQDIEYTGYEIIDLYHSGWENNEGGDGRILFNFEEKTVTLLHNMNYEDEMVEDMGIFKLV
jgi:hypothetical protein